MDGRMRGVAEAGYIEALFSLIQENPFVLESIDQFPFIDTPLHIAAFKGHVDFAMEMMNLKPSFARKLNPAGLSPMHLALLNCQAQVVRGLLNVDKDLVRIKGRGGLTPLHFAVEKGNLDLIAEFLEACPECITDVTVQGQNAIHIAISNNNFETLELLVCWLQKITHKGADNWNKQVLNGIDREGNTVLHIAASINHPQMVGLLLKCKMISKNVVNLKGRSALDMLQGQVNNNETADTLRRAGCVEAVRIPAHRTLAESLRSKTSWFETFKRNMARQNNKISNDMRNAMLVVAVLILTATYQACLSPPGGVWQGNFDDDNLGNSGDNDSGNAAPNHSPVLPGDYHAYKKQAQYLPLSQQSPPSTESNSAPSPKSNSAPSPKSNSDKVGLSVMSTPKVGVSVMPTPNFVYFYIINTATFLTTTCVVLFLLPSQTINLLTLPVLLFILCYLLTMMYLSPFPIILPFFPSLQSISPILVATLVFLVVCSPKFFNLNLQSQGASLNDSAY
ncbi:hypothetical protein SLE2022_109280 [Rubroshorea leprosula]